MSVSIPKRALRALPRRLAAALAGGPQVMAFLPAVTLAAYWLGGNPTSS